MINEARRDYNKVIPLAEGEKDQRIREADGAFLVGRESARIRGNRVRDLNKIQ